MSYKRSLHTRRFWTLGITVGLAIFALLGLASAQAQDHNTTVYFPVAVKPNSSENNPNATAVPTEISSSPQSTPVAFTGDQPASPQWNVVGNFTVGGLLGVGNDAPTERVDIVGNPARFRINDVRAYPNGDPAFTFLTRYTSVGALFFQDALNNQLVLRAGGGAQGANDIVMQQPNGSVNTRIFVSSVGNVGIGTTAPQNNLSVNTALNIDQANINNGSLYPGLTLGISSGEGIASKRTAGGNQYGLDFYTGFVPRMSILNNGNVGVGTTAPDAKLEVTTDSNYGGRFSSSSASADAVLGACYGSGSCWGVQGYSANSIGVFGSTAVSGGYGLYTPNHLYVGNSLVSAASVLIAQNGSTENLTSGDMVAVIGIAKGPTHSYSSPILLVQKIDQATGQAAIGVVEGRYTVKLGNKPEEPAQIASSSDQQTSAQATIEDAHSSADPAAPGELLTVIYRGLAQVKVDASVGAIKVGDALTAASVPGSVMNAQVAATHATTEGVIPSVPVIGKAVESFSGNTGMLWVLVNLQ